MTAIDTITPAIRHRRPTRLALPTIDLDPFKARIAGLIGVPRVMPGCWIA